jgi:hypothetical protein
LFLQILEYLTDIPVFLRSGIIAVSGKCDIGGMMDEMDGG